MRAEQPPGELRCCGGLPFLNIIKTYLFCVPHVEHPPLGDRSGSPRTVSGTSGPARLGLILTRGGQVWLLD